MSLEVEHIRKSFGGSEVLSDISFTAADHFRIGLIGANGSGKTTLMKVLAGIEKPDSGVVHVRGTVGYVSQVHEYPDELSVSTLLATSVRSHEHYKVERALTTVGIESCQDTPFGSLSSGQKTRVYLARLILDTPDILLLDEPTNHLDAEALLWLENYVRDYAGSVLIISHDRRFLDAVAHDIFELESGTVKRYGGNYSFYKEQKEVERAAQVRAYESQQKEIKRLTKSARDTKENAARKDADNKPTRDNDKFAASFFANRSSKKLSAASKKIEQRIDAMDTLDKPQTVGTLKALFKSKNPTPPTVVRCEKVFYERGGHEILRDCTCTINKGDRIALSGPNGSGKTTLIKLILGELAPTQGDIIVGPSVSIGYVSQSHSELMATHSVLHELIEVCGIDETTAYRLLKKFLLPSSLATHPVHTLSSGEQSKLLLAEVMAQGANLIILDEPTNHLEIPAREALEAALREYDGALLVVSHDRYFLENIGINRWYRVEGGSFLVYFQPCLTI
jgi:ATPase subunit of ABC transporter with duplicated ATPase domains